MEEPLVYQAFYSPVTRKEDTIFLPFRLFFTRMIILFHSLPSPPLSPYQ